MIDFHIPGKLLLAGAYSAASMGSAPGRGAEGAAVTSGLSTVAGPTADILHYRVGGGLSYEALNTP